MWLVELHDAGAALISAAHGAPPTYYCRRAERALTLALQTPVERLNWQERVLAQNLALRVVASPGCVDPPTTGGHPARGQAPRALAARVVRRMALPEETLRRLGAAPMPDLDRFTGSRARWHDMEARQVPLIHDGMEAFTRAFRPIRSGTTRAIFSQLLAVDTRWTPHVTPLVGRVELRQGLGPDAPACVAKLAPGRLRCKVGGLLPIAGTTPDAKHVRSVFVDFVLDRMRCNECHGESSPRARTPGDALFGDLGLLAPGKAGHHLTRRRAEFLKGAAALAERTRKLLSLPAAPE